MTQDEKKQIQETEEKNEPQTQETEMTESPDSENQTETKEEVETSTAENPTQIEAEADKPTGQKSDELKTVKLEDVEEEKEYTEDDFEKFAQIYESTISKYSEGEIIKGKILSIDGKDVSVDIGFKSEGIVPIDEFSNISELKPGDEIEVFIDTIEDKDGQLILSRKKADFMRSWEKVVEMAETGETTTGRITRRIKGGMVVDLSGVEAFLPGSQIDVKPIRDFDALIGQEFEFKIVNVNHMRKNIVVSRRVLIEEEMKDQREKIISELEKGQVLEGSVKNITNFGVFIDLGGVDGLLHINDLSWGRIGHPSEVVSLDEKIKVMVLDYDEEKNRISLGYKQLQPHPWDHVEEKYPVGQKISGKVVNIADYGAFVELEKGIEGLIHISEMSWTQHIKHPTQLLKLGDTVEAVILNVEKDEHKISLGLKQMQPDPWANIEEKYPVGSRHSGIVRNLTNFGAFVELEEGVDGLVHISDLSWTRKIRHPSEVIKRNDEIEVEVLTIDQDNRRISLGYKQIFDNPWDTLQDRYQVAVRIKGKITRCIDKGVIVEIPEEVEGFVPVSHLKRMEKAGHKRTSDAYKVNEELELIVIEFDKDNKRIVLSEKDPEELKEVSGAKADEKKTEEETAGKTKAETKEPAKKETGKKKKTEPEDSTPEKPGEEAPEATEVAPEEEKSETNEEKAEKVEKAPDTEPSEAVVTTEQVEPIAEEKVAESAGDVSEPAKDETSRQAVAEKPDEPEAKKDEAVKPKKPAKPRKKKTVKKTDEPAPAEESTDEKKEDNTEDKQQTSE